MEVSTGNSNQSIVYLDASSTMAEFIVAELCWFSFFNGMILRLLSLNILFFEPILGSTFPGDVSA